MGHYSSQPVSQVLPDADAAFDLKGAGSDTSSAQNGPWITVPKADISDSEGTHGNFSEPNDFESCGVRSSP